MCIRDSASWILHNGVATFLKPVSGNIILGVAVTNTQWHALLHLPAGSLADASGAAAPLASNRGQLGVVGLQHGDRVAQRRLRPLLQRWDFVRNTELSRLLPLVALSVGRGGVFRS